MENIITYSVNQTMSDEQFEKIYQMLDQSFPEQELRTAAGQKALFTNPYYRAVVSWLPDGSPLAFLGVWEFDTFRFVEHFAVAPAGRGKGTGGEFLRRYQQSGTTPVILEVEHPQTEIASRRIGFYERHGFALNHYPYEQPAMRAGQKPLPLLIMSWPRGIKEEEFRQTRRVLYTEVYHVADKIESD